VTERAQVRLRADRGPLAGTVLTWEHHDVALLGRAPECHVLLPETDTTTSRNHAVLEVNPPKARLRDLGSRNGTIVNGVRHGGRGEHETPDEGARTRHPDVELAHADVVELGAHRFVVEVSLPATVADDQPAEGDGDKINTPRLAAFVVERLLGRGGFGTVSLARPPGGGAAVALKVLLPRAASSEVARRRFLREAETQARLEHPNIVRLHDVGEDGEAMWFSMEYCDGGSLSDLLDQRGGILTAAELIPLALDALDGLALAHERGIVHRDLKPPNLLLAGRPSGGWTAKVGDLGLAKSYVEAGLSGMTVTGTYAGSWPYMPREQLCDFRNVRPTGDVWSFGATLYHALTRAFPRDDTGFVDPATAVLSAPIVPIGDRLPSLAPRLASEIDRALSLDPTRRHADAAELRDALRDSGA
jgi:serine/threonine protein kinase